MIPVTGEIYRITGTTRRNTNIDEIVEILSIADGSLYFEAKVIHYIINPSQRSKDTWTQLIDDFPGFVSGTDSYFHFEKIDLTDFPEYLL